MYSQIESQVLRTMAVIALAAAFLIAAYIIINSGVLGGSSSTASDAGEAIDATASAAPAAEDADAPAAEGEASGEEPAGSQTTPTSSKTYVVQEGDSFYTISRQFNTSISEIQQLNPNLDPSNLSPGTRVVVP